MASINQAPQDHAVAAQPAPGRANDGARPATTVARVAVPDFRNIGALVRILFVANVLLLATALVRAEALSHLAHDWGYLLGRAQLPILLAALFMYALGTWLPRLSWRELCAMASSNAMLATVLAQAVGLLSGGEDAHLRQVIWSAVAALLVVAYFRWLQIEQTPALDEARILALTARIRPHFFFNSLNGVLGVIRSDPRRAEQALESLAELFRELMKDNRELVPLCDEIDLCNRYLELERLRLGDRLKVKWELKFAPLEAKVPPLMLQPLIENAVYHGIEPSAEPGTVHIGIVRKGRALEIGISNPLTGNPRRSTGNRMALNNIRERLALFFDLEAFLSTEERDGQFRVRIRMPLRKEEK